MAVIAVVLGVLFGISVGAIIESLFTAWLIANDAEYENWYNHLVDCFR